MRGEIMYRARAKQLVDFSGMRFGNITPTDLDGHVDYQNKCAVFFEIKHNGAPLPKGQELALERLVSNSTVPAVAFVSSHDVGDPAVDIDAAATTVTRYYWRGRWYSCEPRTLYNMVRIFLEKHGGYIDKS